MFSSRVYFYFILKSQRSGSWISHPPETQAGNSKRKERIRGGVWNKDAGRKMAAGEGKNEAARRGTQGAAQPTGAGPTPARSRPLQPCGQPARSASPPPRPSAVASRGGKSPTHPCETRNKLKIVRRPAGPRAPAFAQAHKGNRSLQSREGFHAEHFKHGLR